jgi:hypothetical protein
MIEIEDRSLVLVLVLVLVLFFWRGWRMRIYIILDISKSKIGRVIVSHKSNKKQHTAHRLARVMI